MNGIELVDKGIFNFILKFVLQSNDVDLLSDLFNHGE